MLVDGQPVLKPMAGLNVQRVVNTQALIVNTGAQFYLTALNFWYQAAAIEGPWTCLDNPPAYSGAGPGAAVAAVTATPNQTLDLMQPEPGAPQLKTPPAVRVSTVPMDMDRDRLPAATIPGRGGESSSSQEYRRRRFFWT